METKEPRKTSAPSASSPPPRGPALWKIVLGIIVIGGAMWAGSAWGGRIAQGSRHLWRLVANRGHVPSPPATQPGQNHQYYTCGMHPWVVLPKPGDCPICGMKLVPLDPAKFSGEVTINPVVEQNIGVRVAAVTEGPLVQTIRTVGSVDYDETRLYDVSLKTAGWIEKLYVNYLGVPVKKGEPLFDLYAPELYAAQEEYLQAWKNRDRIGTSFLPDAARQAQDLLSAARTRLEYFDISAAQIEELQRRGRVLKTMTLYSPANGVVIDKRAVEGMKLNAGMQVYRIADLSKVWVIVTLYEYQLPYVAVGEEATMSLPYIPGETFRGKVLYVYPYLDKKTRQANVRLEFDNAAGILKPGMFATIQLHSTLAKERVLAPRSAVIDTGERQVAFVSLGDGRFEPRQVKLGVQTGDDQVEILEGLKTGEMVVTSGQFLIDSEAKVREALARMVTGNLAAAQAAPGAPAALRPVAVLPPAAETALKQLLQHYFAIGGNLALGSMQDVSSNAQTLAQDVDDLLKVEMPGAPHFWHQHMEAATIRGKALELAQTPALDQARLKFADLSTALDQLIQATGVPASLGQSVEQLHCPMYRPGQGGTIWLQPAGEVRNPFMGPQMIGCFDQRQTLAVAK